ncbi:unnamed protein product [Oncorhynchus mykiss]|uniref:UBZ1-type domain-containing protein n=1 Tax=Oncorhynchus mykiss TaxID=8022 RepID=A0A060XND1_ONCMY|nr:unnamed protein product [Oncorhynchus mykiss]
MVERAMEVTELKESLAQALREKNQLKEDAHRSHKTPLKVSRYQLKKMNGSTVPVSLEGVPTYDEHLLAAFPSLCGPTHPKTLDESCSSVRADRGSRRLMVRCQRSNSLCCCATHFPTPRTPPHPPWYPRDLQSCSTGTPTPPTTLETGQTAPCPQSRCSAPLLRPLVHAPLRPPPRPRVQVGDGEQPACNHQTSSRLTANRGSFCFDPSGEVHKRCPLCEVIFPPHFEQRSFEQHVESHWKVCPVCSEQFPLHCHQQLFQKHVLTHFDGHVLNFTNME